MNLGPNQYIQRIGILEYKSNEKKSIYVLYKWTGIVSE